MAVSFVNQVEIVHIKHLNYHVFKTLDISRCSMVKFSNGGHLLVCVVPKEIRVYHSFNLTEPIDKISNNAQISDISFNHDDTEMCIVSKTSCFLKKYSLPECKINGEGVTFRGSYFQAALFHKEVRSKDDLPTDPEKRKEFLERAENDCQLPKDKFYDQVFAVGTSDKGIFTEWYDDKENQEGNLLMKPFLDVKEFTQIAMIRKDFKKFSKEPLSKKKIQPLKNLLMATDSGRIFVYGLPEKDKEDEKKEKNYLRHKLECDIFNTHYGAITCMKVHYDSSLVVTGGKDGSIIVYRVDPVANKKIGAFFKKMQ